VAASSNISAHKKVIDLFFNFYNRIRYLDKSSFELVTEIYCNGPYFIFLDNKEKRYFANKLASIIHPGFGSNTISWIQNGLSIYDLYRIHLNLDSTITFNYHLVSENQKLIALELFNKLKLKPNKTILLFPDSHTLKWHNNDFITELIKYFEHLNYDVIIDSNNSKYASESRTTQLELGIIVPFMDLCGFSIILRSGMADLTNGTHSKRAILYPTESYMSTFSLSDNGWNLIELVPNDNINWFDLIETNFSSE